MKQSLLPLDPFIISARKAKNGKDGPAPGVDPPPCYLRNFTPGGQFLVAFSYDQKSVLAS